MEVITMILILLLLLLLILIISASQFFWGALGGSKSYVVSIGGGK